MRRERVEVLIGTPCEPFEGFILESMGGVFADAVVVVNRYQRRVHCVPSVALTYHRYVVPGANPEMEQIFVPFTAFFIETRPIFGEV